MGSRKLKWRNSYLKEGEAVITSRTIENEEIGEPSYTQALGVFQIPQTQEAEKRT
ncbi:hypothetical protein LguiB_027263 [Lonicera macranthoides]